MPEDKTSMDEILASIRRIISDDPTAPSEQKDAPEEASILELQDIFEKRKITETNKTSSHIPSKEASAPLQKKSSTPAKTLISHISKQERLAEGFEIFLESTLEKIVRDFLEDWADKNMPKLAEEILREQIRLLFETRTRKEG